MSGGDVMNEGIAIQDNDVVVTRVVNQFWVWQQIGESRKRLDGPFADRAEAESRAKELANNIGSDPWFETESAIATLL
jgi:hypothetical protein